jgi:hypothetical protein
MGGPATFGRGPRILLPEALKFWERCCPTARACCCRCILGWGLDVDFDPLPLF